MRWLGLFLVFLVGVGAGCEGSGPSRPSLTSVEGLANAITAGFCAWQFRCCSGIEITSLEQGRYATEEACVASGVAVAVADQLALVGGAVRGGHITIDPTAAAACVDAYRTRVCNPVLTNASFARVGVDALPDVATIVAGCPGLLTGAVPLGERCEMTAECAAGARCVSTNTVATAISPVSGVCERYRALGETCSDSSQCDPAAGLYCRGTDFTCAVPAGANEACMDSPSGGEPPIRCDATHSLVCDSTARVCRRLPGADEPCLASIFPGSSVLSCDPDPALALQCVGLQLFGTGICKRAGQENDACGGVALPLCRPGLACLATQADGIGVCSTPPGEGESCASGGVCGFGTACDPSSYHCAVPGSTGLGFPCTVGAECSSLNCGFSGSPGYICLPPIDAIVCAGGGTTPGTGENRPKFDGGFSDGSGSPPNRDGGPFDGGSSVDVGTGSVDVGTGNGDVGAGNDGGAPHGGA